MGLSLEITRQEKALPDFIFFCEHRLHRCYVTYAAYITRIRFLPLPFLPDSEPWPVEPCRYWEGHSPDTAASTAKGYLVKQQIGYSSKMSVEELPGCYTSAQALGDACCDTCTKVQDGIIRPESSLDAAVTESTLPCIVHPITIVLVCQDT
jgi:hypothetical protein